MTDVAIVAGEQLLIQIGDGADPENFTHSCLINTTRDITFKTNLTETEVADCADQSQPAKIVRKAKSIDFTVSGAGKTDAGRSGPSSSGGSRPRRRTARSCRTCPARPAAGPAPAS
jgi:hypothetical protein